MPGGAGDFPGSLFVRTGGFPASRLLHYRALCAILACKCATRKFSGGTNELWTPSPPYPPPILLDGATGTELYKRGMPHGVCTEQWVLEHPDALLELQRAYVDAGSQVLIAPTFGANRVTLARYGLSGQVSVYNRRLAALTPEGRGRAKPGWRGDLAPQGSPSSPSATPALRSWWTSTPSRPPP